ncbi:hypothetical protein R50072_05150 [Simiduia litorea]|uniref:formyltransferase family protein n=1 Tax=Simiduia litorea TaxID=1435348 RepID=UPI0036F412B3
MGISEFKATYKNFGTSAVFTLLTDRVLSRLGVKKIERVFTATEQSTNCPFPARLLNVEEAKLLKLAGKLACSDQAIADIEREKLICIGAFDQDTLCGYCWYALEAYRHSDSDYAFFHKDYICGHNAYINPDYRGKQVRSAIVAKAIELAVSIDRKGIISAITWTNFASLKSAQKLNYKSAGIAYRSQKIDIFIDKSLYHLRRVDIPYALSSALITPSITQVTEALAQRSTLSLIIDTGNSSLATTGLKARIKRRLKRETSVQAWAAEQGIEYVKYSKATESDIAQLISARKIDLLVSYAAPLLGDAIISAAKIASINIHPSLLPAYRGGSPLPWQVIEQERITGATVHLLNSKIDQGPILGQVESKLPNNISRTKLIQLARSNAARALTEVLADYAEQGEFSAKTQPVSSTTRFAKNITLANLMDIVNWQTAPSTQLCAIANYLERWPTEICSPPGLLSYLPWQATSASDIQQTGQSNKKPWRMTLTGLRYNNPSGSVLLRPILSPWKLLAFAKDLKSIRSKQSLERSL